MLQDFDSSAKRILDNAYNRYHKKDFIPFDPISIPHKFSKRQDIEVMGLFASILAWGQRKTIINKCKELISLFENDPHNFILNHSEQELKPLEKFVHRTFNGTDLLYFVYFLKEVYLEFDSLESAFFPKADTSINAVEKGLNHFRKKFTSSEWFPQRTGKHVASPDRGSACKRLNMFLRWMVREDDLNIDFGIWKNISPSQLICPLDVHVLRVSEKMKLIENPKPNWSNAILLTEKLRMYDPSDPVKYDFALFGMGESSEIVQIK